MSSRIRRAVDRMPAGWPSTQQTISSSCQLSHLITGHLQKHNYTSPHIITGHLQTHNYTFTFYFKYFLT